MKIDVIIPTFNRAGLLARAIDSVLKQSVQDFHLYVMDDGSIDETPAVLKNYLNHPKLTVLTQKNAGVSAARNAAVKASSNEWLSFLDSDDEWLPNKLERQIQFLTNHPQYRFLHAEEIWMRNGVRVNPKIKHCKSGPDLFQRSLEFCLISPSTVMMKRELFLEHEGFDEELVVCEDFDLWNKILATEEVGFLDEFVTKKYGGHEDQLSTKYVAMDYWRIKSLLKLSQNEKLSSEKKELAVSEIRKKAPLLLRGYLKHQNLEKHQEVLQMLAHLDLTPST